MQSSEKKVPSVEEASECLNRIIRSATNSDKPGHPGMRMSIPVDYTRDDDMLLSAFIQWAKERDEATKFLREACISLKRSYSLLGSDGFEASISLIDAALKKAEATHDERRP